MVTKLAFLVVYVFDEETKPLFDIHLGRLRKHTRVDFRIFAAAHKLSGDMLAHVQSQPEIETIDCEVPRHFSVREEHSHCLEALAKHAMAQDFTHCMTLHLDSFPIHDNWLEELMKSFEEGASIVSLTPNGYSAGLLWPREFYETQKPRMLVPEEERSSDAFARFEAEFPDFDHVETGLGYIFQAWRLGLGWRRVGTDHERKIYEGIFFHMVGATYMTWADAQRIKSNLAIRVLWQLLRPAIRLLPLKKRRRVRLLFTDKDTVWRDGSARSKKEETALLMADPERYISSMVEAYEPSVGA